MQSKPVYLSADQLGIEQWEHNELVALIGPLSRGELQIAMEIVVEQRDRRSYVFPHRECGTVACIGGFIALNHGMSATEADLYVCNILEGAALDKLFYPLDDEQRVRSDVTSQQASHAIVNFLTLADPRWDDVLRS